MALMRIARHPMSLVASAGRGGCSALAERRPRLAQAGPCLLPAIGSLPPFARWRCPHWGRMSPVTSDFLDGLLAVPRLRALPGFSVLSAAMAVFTMAKATRTGIKESTGHLRGTSPSEEPCLVTCSLRISYPVLGAGRGMKSRLGQHMLWFQALIRLTLFFDSTCGYPGEGPPQAKFLDICTANVTAWRSGLLALKAGDWSPSICCLQEHRLCSQNEIDSARAKHGRSGGTGIIWKSHIRATSTQSMELPNAAQNRATAVNFQLLGMPPFTLVSIYGHVDSQQHTLELLNSIVASTTNINFVIAGGVNMPTEATCAWLKTNHPTARIVTAGPSCCANNSQSDVDHFVCSKNIYPFVVDAATLSTTLATHRPVQIRIATTKNVSPIALYTAGASTHEAVFGPGHQSPRRPTLPHRFLNFLHTFMGKNGVILYASTAMRQDQSVWDEFQAIMNGWREIAADELMSNCAHEGVAILTPHPHLENTTVSAQIDKTRPVPVIKADAWTYIHRRFQEANVASANGEPPLARRTWGQWKRTFCRKLATLVQQKLASRCEYHTLMQATAQDHPVVMLANVDRWTKLAATRATVLAEKTKRKAIAEWKDAFKSQPREGTTAAHRAAKPKDFPPLKPVLLTNGAASLAAADVVADQQGAWAKWWGEREDLQPDLSRPRREPTGLPPQQGFSVDGVRRGLAASRPPPPGRTPGHPGALPGSPTQRSARLDASSKTLSCLATIQLPTGALKSALSTKLIVRSARSRSSKVSTGCIPGSWRSRLSFGQKVRPFRNSTTRPSGKSPMEYTEPR